MRWLRRFFVRPSDLDDEIAAHLAMKAERLRLDEGLSESEALAEARRRFGNRTLWKERAREERSLPFLEGLGRDIVFAGRLLGKDRRFSLLAIATLALGIGANTAFFSLLNALLWRPLPIERPDELVRLRAINLPPAEKAWLNGRATTPKERRQIPFSLYTALAKEGSLFRSAFGVAGHGEVSVGIGAETYRLWMTSVTGSYFDTLGVRASAGRLLTPADDTPGGPGDGWGAVLGDAAWERLFARSPQAIGAKLTVERVPFTVIGVAPPGFHGIHPGTSPDIWIPVSSFEATYPQWRWRTDPGAWMLQPFARLAPGVTPERARARLHSMSRGLLGAVPNQTLLGSDLDAFLAMKIDAEPARSGYSALVETFAPTLWMLLGAVALVLLIAAANLAGLTLARSTARRREITTRLALGASPGRVRRQLLVESALLVAIGCAAAIPLAIWLADAMPGAISNGSRTVALDVRPDATVALFLAAALAAVLAITGTVPAWFAVRDALAGGARQTESRFAARVRAIAVAAQIAVSVVLLGGAGLLIESMRRTLAEPTGFASRRTLFLSADLFGAGVSRERMPRAYERIQEEAARLPGVRAAAWTMHLPLTNTLQAFTIEVEGGAALPAGERMVMAHQVTDRYFEALGIPLIAGRDFHPSGAAASRQSIVSEALARRFFGSAAQALGRRLKPGKDDWTEIVGVAADTKYQHVREPAPPTVYTSYWDRRTALGLNLALSYDGPRESLVAAVQGLMRREAGRTVPLRAASVEDNLMALLATDRLIATLLSAFAAFALLLTAIGVAGALGYSVALRRKEIGIRLALGASPGAVARGFVGYALLLAVPGLLAGVATSFVLRRTVSSYLFRIDAFDLRLWAVVAAVLLTVALSAAAIPARRAARVDPVETLRAE